MAACGAIAIVKQCPRSKLTPGFALTTARPTARVTITVCSALTATPCASVPVRRTTPLVPAGPAFHWTCTVPVALGFKMTWPPGVDVPPHQLNAGPLQPFRMPEPSCTVSNMLPVFFTVNVVRTPVCPGATVTVSGETVMLALYDGRWYVYVAEADVCVDPFPCVFSPFT